MQKFLIRRLIFKIFILAVTATGMPFTVLAQQALITLPTRGLSAQEVFDAIESQTEYKFTVNRSAFDGNLKVKITQPQMTVTGVLDKLFAGSGVTYGIEGRFIVVPLRQPSSGVRAATAAAKAPLKGNIQGFITNTYTRERIAGVRVQLVETEQQATTDPSGRFRLEGVAAGSYAAKISIPQFDTVIYRDMLVRAGATTQHDINIALIRESEFTPEGKVMLPVAPVNRKPRQEYVTPDAGHAYVLVDAPDYLALPRPATAIKTNILYYIGLTPNLAAEFRLAPRWTLDVAMGMNPGKFDRNIGSLRHWFIQPEGRFWFCGAFERHFIGLHGLGWQFDVTDVKIPLIKDFTGTRYEGYGVGAGLSYGYHLPIAARWSIEFSLGVGYMYLDYSDYESNTSTEYTRNSDKHYFGPTKAALSLMFMIK